MIQTLSNFTRYYIVSISMNIYFNEYRDIIGIIISFLNIVSRGWRIGYILDNCTTLHKRFFIFDI